MLFQPFGKHLLQCLLTGMAQQLFGKDFKIELRGKEADQIQEYIKKEKLDIPVTKVQADDVKDLSSSDDKMESRSFDSQKMKRTLEAEETLVISDGEVISPLKTKPAGMIGFSRLDNKVKTIQAQVEALATHVMPTDDSLLEATRTNQLSTPISDLFQSLNITKRMSGAEEGIDKLASLLETIAKEYATLKTLIDKVQEEMGEDIVEVMKQIKLAASYAKQIRPRDMLKAIKKQKDSDRTKTGDTTQPTENDTKVDTNLNDGPDDSDVNSQDTTPPTTPHTQTFATGETEGDKENLLFELDSNFIDDIVNKTLDVIQPLKDGEEVDRDKINEIIVQHEYLRNNYEYLTAQVNTLADFADKILPEVLAGMPHQTELNQRIKKLRGVSDSQHSTDEIEEDKVTTMYKERIPVPERIREMEAKILKHSAKLKRQDFMICEKMMEYDQRIVLLTSAIDDIIDLLHQHKKIMKDNRVEDMNTILQKIDKVEEAVISVGITTQALNDDLNQKNVVLDSITAEIELAKTVKADRYELEDILAQKADCKALFDKVDMGTFENTMKELEDELSNRSNKVILKTEELYEDVAKIQESLARKFEKSDLEDVLTEIRDTISVVTEQIEKLTAMKEGRVAAGAKQKFITNINCISCDRNVSMHATTGAPCIPALADLPTTKSTRPFITYEIDYLRKMKIKDPEKQNFIHYEELAQRYKIKNLDSYEQLQNVPHLKSRYCGGSHTMIGPQQKVPHVGHFRMNDDPYN